MNLSGQRSDSTRQLNNPLNVSTSALALSGYDGLPLVFGAETDPIFSAWDKSTGIVITESQIVPGITFPVTLSGIQTLTNKTILSPLGLTKNDVGLSLVDNTADLSKPLSIAMLSALFLKEDLSNKSINIITDALSDTKYPSVKATKTYVDSKIVGVFAHNDTTSKQGGSAGEYYHLTSAQHTIATQTATAARAGYLSAADFISFSAAGTGIATSLVTTNFSIEESGGKLVIKYGSTVIASFSSAGYFKAKDEVGAFTTP
jgi:hypothetical protein